MKLTVTPMDLVKFEKEVADLFAAKKIRAPVHLSSGNERQLAKVFERHVDTDDYILCTWRSHLHCLLKGVPPDVLKDRIVQGQSIALCFPEHKILSSAIVGGVAPIAVGLASGIKMKGDENKVVCFIGDMAAESGIVFESMKYAINHKLPVLWVIEDNGKSVDTDTVEAWGGPTSIQDPSIIRYRYRNKYPHVGLEKWVQF